MKSAVRLDDVYDFSDISAKIEKTRDEAVVRIERIKKEAEIRMQSLREKGGCLSRSANVSTDVEFCLKEDVRSYLHRVIIEQRQKHNTDLYKALKEALLGVSQLTAEQKEQLITWYMKGSQRKVPAKLVKARAKAIKIKKN